DRSSNRTDRLISSLLLLLTGVRPPKATLFPYTTLFRSSEWKGDVPSKEEIIEALREQEGRIENFFKDKLQNKASKVRDLNGMKLETVDHALQFITWHEGIHIGDIKGLRLRTK